MHAQTIALAAAVLITAPVLAQEAAPADRDAIVSKHLSPLIDAYQIPGAMVGLYHDGEVTFHSIGTLDYDQDQAPDTGTIYEIGSIGKVITGVFFADAIRRGEVTRHTTLQELVPDGVEVVRGDEGTAIELWHLTTHTSGWGTVPINLMPADPDRPFHGYTTDMLYAAHEKTPLAREPGSGFEYSNFAVGTLGTVLAANAGGGYESLVRERILAPLGIDDFAVSLSDEQQQRLAPPTNAGLTTKPWGERENPLAPAGLWSATAPALMTFAVANLAEAKPGTPAVYESLATAREPLYFVEPMGQSVCFGWFIAADAESRWHNGMTGGYSSYMGINHAHDAAAVVLTNGATFNTTLAGEKIFQELLGMSPDPLAIPVPQRLDDAYADRLVGTYASPLGFSIEITSTNGFIYARVTNQQALRVDRVSEHRFRYNAVDAELGFELSEDGDAPATSVTLFQGGREMRCERVEG